MDPGGMFESKPVQECDIMDIRSRRRNPVLADIFSRLKYMERRGSGFKKICNEYAHQVNYSEEIRPIFYSNNQDFVLALYNLNYGMKEDKIEGDVNKRTCNGPIIWQELPQMSDDANIGDRTVKTLFTAALRSKPNPTCVNQPEGLLGNYPS